MSIELAVDLVQALFEAGILSTAQSSAVNRALQRHPDLAPSELGTELVKKGLATRFQIDEVLSGRTARLVRGKYILRDRIRAGPMGVVYRALHPDLGIDVVLKELPASILSTPTSTERFRREVRTLALFRHPRIVCVFDASLESSPPFLVMEYVAGVNLQELIEKQGPLSLPQALRIAIAAAEALQAVHEHGVVHRDVKPSNLMISKEGDLKLIDFGLARVHSSTDTDSPAGDLTGAFVVGTPDYMSPEQCGSGATVDQRADIYSLGCTLLFLLSGEPPVPIGSLADKIAWHQSGAIPQLSNWAPHAPAELDDVFQTMMARHPDQRWQSCSALIKALQRSLEQVAAEPDETIPVGQLVDDDTSPVVAEETRGGSAETPAVGHRGLAFELVDRETPPAPRPRRRWDANTVLLGSIASAGVVALLVGLIFWGAASHAPSNKPVAGKVKKNPARRVIAVAKTSESGDFKFEIGPHNLLPAENSAVIEGGRVVKPPGQLPEELIPANVQWNSRVTAQLDPIFAKKCRSGAGRLLYSEIDTAIEQDCDGEWLVGNTLTKDRSFWHFVLTDGVLTSSPLAAAEAAEAGLTGNEMQRSVDIKWTMRFQPLISIESVDLEISQAVPGVQRASVSLLCKPRNEVVFDGAQLCFEYDTPTQGPQTHTNTVMENLDWTSPPSGWRRFEFDLPTESELKPGTTIRLNLTAFAYEPRPSFYRICKQYEFNWQPGAGTLPKQSP